MDTAAMRRLDSWVGLPACWLLTAHRRMHARSVPDAAPRRVLVVKLAEQGATVVAAPALERLAQAVGPDQLFMMVFAENRPVLDLLGIVPRGNVLTLRTSSVTVLTLDLWRSLRRVRREGVDTVIDLESFSRASAVISYLSGASRRVGHHARFGDGASRGDLMTHRVAANPLLHAADGYLALVELPWRRADSLPALPPLPAVDTQPPRVQPDRHSRRAADSLLTEIGIDRTHRVVVVNANAGDLIPQRRWPETHYVQLVEHLLVSDDRVRVVLTGGPGEVEPADRIESAVGSTRCRSVAGRTTLAELMALYDLSDVLVTNDSGPAHFATMTGIDVVTLFGPESPQVFGARSPRSHALHAGLPCSPCVNTFNGRQTACGDNFCMQQIRPQQVAALVVELLKRRAAQEPVSHPTSENATNASGNPSKRPSARSSSPRTSSISGEEAS